MGGTELTECKIDEQGREEEEGEGNLRATHASD